MNPLFFIFGALIIAQFSFEHSSSEQQLKTTFFTPSVIQQDSTTPPKKNGVVKIKELGAPASQKTTKKKNNTKAKANNKSQKKVAHTASNPKKKESSTSSKNTTPKKKKNKPKKTLSLEEEIKILAKTNGSDAPDKVHPNSQENCNFAFDITDEFTGVQKRGLTARPFFSYTPDEYRKFIKEGDFIRCEGFLSQSSSGDMALNINLYVSSRDAKHKFGGIKPNSAMVLQPMNGKNFYLMTYQGAQPQVVDNMTYYQCSFAINKSDLKNLKKAEIDQVKISFQKGFQTYDVFYLDFMIDQFPCFE
ncbi:hypothetical protein [Aureispira anguillae]|uniref:Uncharacterized protein n=1 Tax=Aureispira anguillae TaxID=2864201 RepID=A0A915YGH1_9BACT|nr:hypothetical protein [Aureispira anguillae]BDS12556.1 hypothetical protein AsAng_0032790 [Aureispira anguillae]